MDLSFVAVRVLIAVGGYGQQPGGGSSGSSDHQDRLQAFNHFITSWPVRLSATCLIVALAGVVYMLFRRETSPAREGLRAAIIALGLCAVVPLLTKNLAIVYVMFWCLTVTWVYVFFRHILPLVGDLLEGAAERANPEQRRESMAARRRSSRRGARLEQSLETALHEREAPPK
jgi:hypothetical protein